MNSDNMIYVGLFVFFGFLSTAYSIRCHQCSSFEDSKCADIHPNDTTSLFLKECPLRDDYPMFCRKTVQVILDQPGFKRITRSCGWYLYKTNISMCQVTDTDFKLETACQCFTDGCNGGTVLTPVSALVTLVLAIFARLLFG